MSLAYSEVMQQQAQKAVIGPGANVYASGGIPMGSLIAGMDTKRYMEQAQQLYYTNPWVRSAEGLISRKLAATPHQILAGDPEIEVKSGPLIERLKAGSPLQRLSPTKLKQITIRHTGLCNNAFWYDQPNAAPEDGVLYINPARMTPHSNAAGYLDYWLLDANPATGNDGYRFEMDEILWFQYEPADVGFFGHGLVYSALMKAQLSTAADRHAIHTLESGGRLQGFLTPQKDEYFSDAQFTQTQRELRNVTELDDSAKRMVLLRKPVEFIPTTMKPNELDILGLMRVSKEDIYEIWGVPRSQTGGTTEIGMNSGDRIAYEEAALQQNAIHPRAIMFEETIAQMLKRYDDGYRYHFMQPTFDDERPKYEMLQMAKHGPFTRDERRALVGLPPISELDLSKDGNVVEQDPTILQILPPLPLGRSMITGRLADGSTVEPVGTPTDPNQHVDALNAARGYTGPDQNAPPPKRPLVFGKASLDPSIGEAVASRIIERGDHFLAKPFDLDAVAPRRLIAKVLALRGIGGSAVDAALADTHATVKAIIADGQQEQWALEQYAEAVRDAPIPDPVPRSDGEVMFDAMKALTTAIAERPINIEVNPTPVHIDQPPRISYTLVRDEHERIVGLKPA